MTHTTRPAAGLLLACLLPACLVLALPLPTAGAEPTDASHATLREFYPTGEFDYEVAGARSEAQVLFSRRAAAYLIAPAGADHLYLLLQRQRTISQVPRRVIQQKNGDVDLPATVAPQLVGNFTMDNGTVMIEAPSLRARLVPRGPLLGTHAGTAVLAHSPQYGLTMRAYRTNEAAMQALKGVTGARVEVLFGSWCPRCQQTMGNALRVERELASAGAGIVFEYRALPPPPAAWQDSRFLQAKVEALPTALLHVGDREVGRVAPADWKSFEVVMAKALKR